MSEVLEEFVEPFADGIKTLEQYRRLLLLGELAWNAALRPAPERRKMVEDVLAAGLPGADPEALDIGKSIVEAMITRKERMFDHILRPILSFQVYDTGHSWQLSVASAVV